MTHWFSLIALAIIAQGRQVLRGPRALSREIV